MVCNECGKKVRKGTDFCSFCGTEIQWTAENNAMSGNVSGEEAQVDGEKKSFKKLLLPIISVVLVIAIVLILVIFIPKASNTEQEYVIFEKEDEIVIYENNKEIMTIDYEGEYTLFIEDGKFGLIDQSGENNGSVLYAGYVDKDADVEEIAQGQTEYDFAKSTFAYIAQDDYSTLYVGDFDEIDDAEKIDEDVKNVIVSGDGKAVYYTNYDNDVYVYKNGDEDKLAKDAQISMVGKDGNQVILIEDIDDDEQSLVWYKGDDDFTLSKDIDDVVYLDEESLSMIMLADNDDEASTIYYADKYGKDPVEIIDEVEWLLIDTQLSEQGGDAEHLFYLQDEDWYTLKIGDVGEGEKLADAQDMNMVAYDKERGLYLWYEDTDEIQYFNLKKGEDGSFDLEDDLVIVQYKDGEMLYENEDNEVIYVGTKDEIELFSDMKWELIDANYVLAIDGEQDDNEAYVYHMHKGEATELVENIEDYKLVGNTVYALADYDLEDYEGTVYRMELGGKEAVEVDDKVRKIMVLKTK